MSRHKVLVKLSNGKPVLRVGGGYLGFETFLARYASDELENLLNYAVDGSGKPKNAHALQALEVFNEHPAARAPVFGNILQILVGSFSAVSKPNFAKQICV